VESQGRLRALASELNLAEQRERARLAAEMHDHLQQILVLGKLKLSSGKRFAVGPSAVEQLIHETEEIFDEALQYTHSLVAELSPPVLRTMASVRDCDGSASTWKSTRWP
jgi:signal transduction histidine kinase